jgi:hypothetical protein
VSQISRPVCHPSNRNKHHREPPLPIRQREYYFSIFPPIERF